MAVVAIIPARGGSKGIARKNLRVVGTQNLLTRAMIACRDASGIDVVYVSTDDEEIRRAAVAAGALVPSLRPSELASDTTPTLPVVQHAIATMEKENIDVSTIVLVEPTSPFRTSAHVAATLARFLVGDCRSAVSVTALDRKPENIFVKERYLRRYIEAPREHFPQRQDMEHLCRINSAVYVVGRANVLAGDLMPEPIGFFEMDSRSSINIDTPLDLEFADFIARRDGI